ncbi:MAG: autotransporter-associated beta strand repeat-containing protein [Verrucomicrobiota bacterium]
MNSLISRSKLAAAFSVLFAGLLHSASAQGTKPIIIAQPHGQSLTVGMDAMFRVSAFGLKSPVTYQWRFQNQPILGETNNTYTRFNVQFADAGNYSVAVMNAFGTTLSHDALLTVNQSLLYWDIDGATPGPGGTAPSGSWSDASWTGSATGSGSTTNWIATSTAFFAADTTATGTYTVSLDTNEIVSGINFEEGTVTISGNGALNLTGDGSIFVAGNNTATISSAITGNSALIKTGTGTLRVGGDNDYDGDTIVSAGTLSLETSERIPDASAVTVFGGATLDLNDSNETIGSLSGSGLVELSGGSLTVGANNFDSFFEGIINGSGDVTKIGFSTLTLAGANTFSGFFLNGGTVEAANGQALGAGTITVGPGVNKIASRVFSLNLNNPILLQPGATAKISDPDDGRFELSGVISGMGALLRDSDDAGLVILSGANDFTGGVTIRGGALEIQNSFALGTGLFTIAANNATNPVVLFSTMDLTGEGSLQNPVSISGGFTLASANGIEFSGPITLSGSSPKINIAGFDFDGLPTTASLFISGPISGNSVQLVKTGPGALVLNNGSDYSGSTMIQAGVLKIENEGGSATGTGPVTVGLSQSSPLAPQAVLTGNGIISGNVNLFGTISPGSSPGRISTGSETWNSRAHYLFEINDANGQESSAYDVINITGTLTINANAATPFSIDITTLTTDNTPGALVNFDEANAYAWRIATTTGGILGFDPSKLRINAGTLPVAHGKFSLAVENNGLDLVLHFDPDTNPPAIAFLFPANNAHTTQTNITIGGTASDDLAVAMVLYQIGAGPFLPANGTTNWSAQVSLSFGTNTITVKSVDTSGNESAPVTRDIILDETAPLTIEIVGVGSVTPDLNGQFLVIGQSYTVTAIPGFTNAFSNWSGGVESTEPELTFVMQSNLVLRATFVSAPLLTGVYNGLFYESEVMRHESSGFFTFKVSKKRAFSGKILIDGGSHKFTGRLTSNEVAQVHILRKGKSTLNVLLVIEPGSHHVSGEVSTTDWTAMANGDIAFSIVRSGVAPQAGRHTMSIPASDNEDGSTVAPLGDGYGLIKIAKTGRLRMSGRLADQAVISQSVYLSENGIWPFYRSLYGGKGSIIGWILFTNQPQSSLEGTLSWIKTGRAGGRFYSAGFTNPVVTFGSRYMTLASGTRILNFINASASLSDGNLVEPLFIPAMLSSHNVLSATEETDSHLVVRFNLRNGFFRGSFIHPETGRATSLRGVVLQQSEEARGYFFSTDKAGSVRVRSDDQSK